MPWEPAAPPLLSDENANELGRWALQQMQQLAAALENPDITAYRVLHVEPEKPREGQIVVADGTDWDPGEGAGQYMYIGGAWVFQRSGPEPDSYGTMTDGTTSAPAEIAGDTFKLRANEGVKVTVTNDDATHGDNALHQMDVNSITNAAPALGDKVPFADVSNSNVTRQDTIQKIFDLIGSLTSETSPDFTADSLALYDNSGAVAKRIPMTELSGLRQLISTTALSGSGVDITVPSGYTDLQLRLKDANTSAATPIRIRFSEDAGSNYLSQSGNIFANGFEQTINASNNANFSPYSNSSSPMWGVMDLFDYASSVDKFTREQQILEAGSLSDAAAGGRVVTSTAAINEININVASGSFDSGSVELWGII